MHSQRIKTWNHTTKDYSETCGFFDSTHYTQIWENRSLLLMMKSRVRHRVLTIRPVANIKVHTHLSYRVLCYANKLTASCWTAPVVTPEFCLRKNGWTEQLSETRVWSETVKPEKMRKEDGTSQTPAFLHFPICNIKQQKLNTQITFNLNSISLN